MYIYNDKKTYTLAGFEPGNPMILHISLVDQDELIMSRG
jgi:hypothetical protein